MSTTAAAIAGFQELVGKHQVKPQHSCETILETIEKVRLTKPLAYHQKHITAFLEERVKVLNILADDYLKTKIGVKYPYLDPSLWKLKRNLQFRSDNSSHVAIVKDETEATPTQGNDKLTNISVPLFAWVNLSNKETTYELYKNESLVIGGNKFKLEIKVDMPGMLGGNLRRAYRTALADAYRAAADLLAQDGVGDVLSENLENLKADVLVAWIPTVDALKLKHEVVPPPEPIKYDPAMFIRLRGHCFLVAMWAVDDEVPLEHFIREYTQGSLEKVTKE